MKKISKRMAALAIAGVMALSMGVTAFAAEGDTTSLETHLYKDGKYDSSKPSENRSMGDGAVENTTYVEDANGNYTVTFHFKSSFKAHGVTGHIIAVNLDVDQDGVFDGTNDKFSITREDSEDEESPITAVTFTKTSIPKINDKYDITFTVDTTLMDINSPADIVVLPGVTTSAS